MSNMNNQIDRELGWDDAIEVDGGEFITLQPGDYTFTVKGFERQRFSGSDKMPACPMAVVSIEVIDNLTNRPVTVQHRLMLHTKTEWTISAFFASLGMKKKGEKVVPQWNLIIGKIGKCQIANRNYNGDVYNEVKKFYPIEDEKVSNGSWGF